MINRTKRMMVSKAVIIPRKEYFWGVTPRPGRHSRMESVSILTVLRDHLKVGDKEREITRLLNSGKVAVDGRKVKDRRAPLGFMDLLQIEGYTNPYRMLYDKKGRLVLGKESPEGSSVKLLKVKGKHTVEGGKLQLTFHDGFNTIVDRNDISTGDVVVVRIPERTITDVYKLTPGAKVFLTGGKHVGNIATVKSIEVKESSSENLISFEEGYSTVVSYAFPIGSQRGSYHVPELEVY